MNNVVSFKLAKLLKGFDRKTYYVYNTEGELSNINFSVLCPAPTIAEVVMWLYQRHGIWISVDFKETDESFQHCCRLIHSDNLPRIFCNDGFNSPTAAYEAAIEYTLNNLI